MQDPYITYRNMPQKQKQSLIESAKQSQKYRKANPQGIHEFQEYSFIPFEVDEHHKNKIIKLQL